MTSTTKTTKPKLTPQQARSFNRFSVANAATVEHSLACGCRAYEDVFTYNRWQALGFQVQRGETAIKIPVIIHAEDEDRETGEPVTKRLMHTSAVFCRHQVKPKEAKP